MGLAELDVGGAGQLVGAKLGSVTFAGGGDVFVVEGAAVWQWRGGVSAGERRMSTMEWGKRGEIFGNFFCFYQVEWREICC